MKVQLDTIMAGPSGNHYPGDVIDVTDEAGKALIASRQARPVDDAIPDKGVVTETATAGPGDDAAAEKQTTVKNGAGHRRRRAQTHI